MSKKGALKALSLIIVCFASLLSTINSGQAGGGRASLLFPGTNWCGPGNKGPGVGKHSVEDRCCKQHDHCKHTIRKGSINFCLLNPSPFTWSQCDCDRKFYTCLKSAKSRVADVIGHLFFNVANLFVNCFDFHGVCCHKYGLRRTSWGIPYPSCLKFGPRALAKTTPRY